MIEKDFREASIDVIENDVEYRREEGIGIRKKRERIEFFYCSNNERCGTQDINKYDLTDKWTKIEKENKLDFNDLIELKSVKDRTLEEHNKLMKEKYNNHIREYLLSMGEFKDVPLEEKKTLSEKFNELKRFVPNGYQQKKLHEEISKKNIIMLICEKEKEQFMRCENLLKETIKKIKEETIKKEGRQMEGTSENYINGMKYVIQLMDKEFGEDLIQ